MRQMIEKILNCYGVELVLLSGQEKQTIRGFMQPVTGKNENLSCIEMMPLGKEDDGRFVFIGPVEPGAGPGDQLLRGEEAFILRRSEIVDGVGGPAYRWGLCVRKGAEDTWGMNG